MREGRTRRRVVTALGAAMYALLAGLGCQAQKLGARGTSDLPRALITAAALFVPAYVLLACLLRWSEGKKAAAQRGKPFRAGRAFWLILACYVPMFAITFPGSFAYDVPFQLEQVFTGSYSAHHPLLHTLLMGSLVKLGYHFGNINLGAALYTLVQMAAMAGCFALTCASIARQSSARAAGWAAAFFALYPLHMMLAVNATKDVLFSGLFVLTLALVREALLRGKPGWKLTAGIALCGAAMLLLRNNALYAMAVWLVLALLMLRKKALRTVLAAALAAALCVGAGNAMKTALNASEGDLCEMLSWPIQQMARARNLHGDRLTAQEKTAIDELMPGQAWALYDPTISDPVKFEFDTAQFLSDTGKYAQAYLSVGMKCPQAYLDALLAHTYSFWYPYQAYGVSGYYLQMGISDQYYDWCDFERISSQSLLPRVQASLSWRFGAQGAMQIPGVGYLFNMGVIVWIMLYFAIRDAHQGRWKADVYKRQTWESPFPMDVFLISL